MPTELKELFDKFAAGTATEDETRRLFDLIASGNYDQELTELHLRELENTPDPAIAHPDGWYSDFEKLREQIRREEPAPIIQPQRQGIKRWLIPAAAIFIVALATALYFYSSVPGNEPDVEPGGNKATLTLEDGQKIDLKSDQEQVVVSGEAVKYPDGTNALLIVNEDEESGKPNATPTMLQLSTPRGGQYQIILSDGTKVWLNAASTLKYPSRFSGDSREVFLEGEGYFEVNSKPAGDRVSRVPFIVKSKNQEITVLGTSFNVAAYADESSARTTLVNGAVQVSAIRHAERSRSITQEREDAIQLNPGEQSILSDNKLTKAKADLSSELAWKEGLFSFNDEPLESVMKRVARWYNVDIVYGPGVNKQDLFGGSISRYEKVSSVLKKLELTGGISFRVDQERRIIVEKKP